MGKPVKLSTELTAFLNKRKLRRGEKNVESYDAVIRRMLGLPTKEGEAQELRTYFVLPQESENEPLIFLKKSEARGAAILRSVRRGNRKPEVVITVRELPF